MAGFQGKRKQTKRLVHSRGREEVRRTQELLAPKVTPTLPSGTAIWTCPRGAGLRRQVSESRLSPPHYTLLINAAPSNPNAMRDSEAEDPWELSEKL